MNKTFNVIQHIHCYMLFANHSVCVFCFVYLFSASLIELIRLALRQLFVESVELILRDLSTQT